MIALSFAYLFLAVWLFGLVDRKARRDATLVRF